MENFDQDLHLAKYFDRLTADQQKQAFIEMFNALQEQEMIDCYLPSDQDTYGRDENGDFMLRVFWAHTGDDLTEEL